MKTLTAIAFALTATAAVAEPDYGLKINVASALDGYNRCAVATSETSAVRGMQFGSKYTNIAVGKFKTLEAMGEANSDDKRLLELLRDSVADCITHVKSKGWN